MDLERLDALSSVRGRKRTDYYPLKPEAHGWGKGFGLEICGLRQTEQKKIYHLRKALSFTNAVPIKAGGAQPMRPAARPHLSF